MSRMRAHGFTLTELAVVLLIITLVTAGVLAGSRLIVGGQSKRIAADATALQAAYLVYVDRYRARPGDHASASRIWPGAIDGTGDGIVSGRYDDPAPASAASLVVNAQQGESLNFWAHLRLAQLIGDSEGNLAKQPRGALGGLWGVQTGAFGISGLVGCFDNLPGDVAAAVDVALDDGRADAGVVRAAKAADVVPSVYTDGDNYILCVAMDGARAGTVTALRPAVAPVPPASNGGGGGGGGGGTDGGGGGGGTDGGGGGGNSGPN